MSVFQSDPPRDAEEFWRDVEARLGSPVLSYALGQYVSGSDANGPMWGLFYLTNSALYFHRFAQRNWYSSLVDNRSGGEVTITVPLDTVTLEDATGRSGRGRLARIFGASADTFRLTDTQSGEPVLLFTIEQRGSSLPDQLRDLLSARPGSARPGDSNNNDD